MKNKKIRIALIYFVIAFSFLSIANYAFKQVTTEYITYDEFIEWGETGKIEKVSYTGTSLQIIVKEDSNIPQKIYYTNTFPDLGLVNRLDEWDSEWNVEFEYIPQQSNVLVDFLLYWILPMGLFFFLWRFMMKGMDKRMGGGVMSFGKNSAKIYAEQTTGVTFDDVAGQEEAKESLVEMVDFLNEPAKYTSIGAKLPKGALLVGPPGTGKTLLAKAVAGEAKVPFFSISGSEFVQMFVGMGAAKVRDLFAQAQEKAPCIIFIDEIDAIGKSRENNMSSNDEREQTLNQLLSEMDGFDSSKGVVILGATNRPEVLDQALLRPGRFDRRIIVDRPDLEGRKAILKVHAIKVKMSSDVDLNAIAKTTSGASGAELANVINEAALLAVKHGREFVEQKDLEEAFEIVVAGKVKKDRILSDHEKKSVAYHEIGHALVAEVLPKADPVHKITIIPRTKGSLGYTMQLPSEDKYLVTKEEMKEQLAVMLGGRAAEEIMFNQVSTGAANDIERATTTARRMVTIYGMTDEFDMMALESASSRYLDGRPVRNCSNETERIIDLETLRIIKEQHQQAIKILEENKEKLIKAAEFLLEYETISGEEFKKILNGEEVLREEEPHEETLKGKKDNGDSEESKESKELTSEEITSEEVTSEE